VVRVVRLLSAGHEVSIRLVRMQVVGEVWIQIELGAWFVTASPAGNAAVRVNIISN
jgi:hypothetical protein